MFSLNVGQGTVVSGTFAGINWGVNSKFMQMEMDPAGGSSYIDMGTQQMMSVPYSLNSASLKMRVSATGDTLFSGGGNFVIIPGISAANNPPYPGVISGPATVCAGSTITLTDSVVGGTWSSSSTSVATIGSTGIVTGIAAGTTTISYAVTNSFGSSYAMKVVTVNPLPTAGTITGPNTVAVSTTIGLSNSATGGTWTSSNTSVANVGSTGVVLGVSAGTVLITYAVSGTCGPVYVTYSVTVSATSLTVGTSYGGGIIAYIFASGDPGYVAGQTHGLIAAPSAQSTGIQWYNGSNIITGATGTAIGTGMSNTNYIVAAQGAGSYAAKICYDLVLGGYSDWYLPSRDELNKLYINRAAIGGFSPYIAHWSSSEADSTQAWLVFFAFSGSILNPKNTAIPYVRATRSF
jgi:hypothetical protein